PNGPTEAGTGVPAGTAPAATARPKNATARWSITRSEGDELGSPIGGGQGAIGGEERCTQQGRQLHVEGVGQAQVGPPAPGPPAEAGDRMALDGSCLEPGEPGRHLPS